MATPVKLAHAYSPDQYVRAVDLWERLIGCYHVSLYKEVGRSAMYVEKLEEGQLYELIVSDGEETENHYSVRVSILGYSEHSRSSIYDAANVRTLLEFEGVEGTADLNDGEAWVQLGELPWEGGAVDDALRLLEKIVDAVEALHGDCAVLDDSALDDHREALIERQWSADWGTLKDIRNVLEDVSDKNGDDFEFSDEEIRDLYFGFQGNEWVDDSATSIVNGREDDAIEYVLREIVRAWQRPKYDPDQHRLFEVA